MSELLKVLILTDHSGHSAENSVYALARAMVHHAEIASVDVASRGLQENADFFSGESSVLYASPVDSDFDFSEDGYYMQRRLRKVDSRGFDLVFMRLPRPLSDAQLIHIERVFASCVIINKPSGIINTSSKAFLLNFPSSCPPMQLVSSVEEIMDFAENFPIVLKPLREYGGKGILKINGEKIDDGSTEYDTTQYLTSLKPVIEKEGFLAMKFLKNVGEGDKRILVVGGEVLASSLRLPAENSWLCNVAQGGRSVPTEVTEEELQIVSMVAPRLQQEGVLIYGIDTLVNDDGKRVMSELNTLSVGGFPQSQKQSGRPVINKTLEIILSHARSERK